MARMRPPEDYLKDIRTLAADVERGYHIPAKFRRSKFTEKERTGYVEYLRRVVKRTESKLGISDAKPKDADAK